MDKKATAARASAAQRGQGSLAEDEAVTSVTASPFTQVRTKRGYEYILEQIREAIMSGQYKPGDRLPAERDMAQIFGVSRQAVREAVRGLETAGLVEIRVGVLGGVYVRSGDPVTFTRAMTDLATLGTLSSESLLEARVLLLTSVNRLVCERATEEDYQRLEADVDDFESLVDRSSSQRTAQITHFYRVLAEATRNEVLVMLMDSLAQIVHARLLRAAPKPKRDTAAVRRRVIAHLRAGRADEATKELADHLVALEALIVEAENRLASGKPRRTPRLAPRVATV